MFPGALEGGLMLVEVDPQTGDIVRVTAAVEPGAGGDLPPGGDEGDLLAKASPAPGDAEWVEPEALLPQDGYIVTTVATVNNNAVANTLQDVIGLELPMEAGVHYVFEATIPFNSSQVVNGSRWTLDGPATTQLGIAVRYPQNNIAQTTHFNSAYGMPTATNPSALLTGNVCYMQGTITASVAGILKVRFAARNAGQAITALPGASLTLRPL